MSHYLVIFKKPSGEEIWKHYDFATDIIALIDVGVDALCIGAIVSWLFNSTHHRDLTSLCN